MMRKSGKFDVRGKSHIMNNNTIAQYTLYDTKASSMFQVIFQTLETVFLHISKHWEESWKYDAQR